jgi:arylsulfatase
LDIGGVSIPSSIDGKSLIPICRGDDQEVRNYLHGEHPAPNKLTNQWIMTDRHKYIWFSQTGKEQLFDLKQDPREQNNLIHLKGHEEIRQTLRGLLIQELTGREEGYVQDGDLVSGRSVRSVLLGVDSASRNASQ